MKITASKNLTLTMCRLTLIFLLSLSCYLHAVEIIDGQWNGKHWKTNEIISKAKSGNPDAMAEWAYCSFFGENGIPHDEPQTFQYASKASAKGSVLGTCLEGFCYALANGTKLDIQKAKSLIDEAHATKHPYARYIYGQSLTLGSLGRTNTTEAKKIFREVMQHDVAQASAVLGFFTHAHARSEHEHEEAAELLKYSFEKYGSTMSAFVQIAQKKHTIRLYGDRYYKQVLTRLHKSARLGHPSSLRTLGKMALKEENFDIAIPYLLQAANNADHNAIRTLISFAPDADSPEPDTPVKSNYIELGKLAAIAYRAGSRNRRVSSDYLHHLRISRARKQLPEEATLENMIKVAREVIAAGDCNTHDTIAGILLYGVTKFGDDDAFFERGLQHAIYHSDHSDTVIYTMSLYFLDPNHTETFDIVKGLASAETALAGTLDDARRNYLTGLAAKFKEQATDEDLNNVKKLTKQNYPKALKWREEAFLKLQQYGDLPADWQFGNNRLRD